MLTQLVFACLLLGVAARQPSPISAEEVIDDCAYKYKLKHIHYLRMVLIEPGAPVRPTFHIKCAVLCYMTSTGFMTPNGYIKMDEVKANTTPAGKFMYDIILQCKDIPAIDECDRAYQINYCIGMKIAEKNVDAIESNSEEEA